MKTFVLFAAMLLTSAASAATLPGPNMPGFVPCFDSDSGFYPATAGFVRTQVSPSAPQVVTKDKCGPTSMEGRSTLTEGRCVGGAAVFDPVPCGGPCVTNKEEMGSCNPMTRSK
jgi:hypothetical protein